MRIKFNIKYSKLNILLIVFLFTTFSLYLYSAGPNTITYQGTVTTSGGGAPANGNYAMLFSLWNVVSGGTPETNRKWLETHTGTNAVTVTNGAFSVELGSLTSFPTNLFRDYPNLWLQVSVDLTGTTGSGFQVYSPRVAFTSSPYAFQSDDSDTVDGKHASELTITSVDGLSGGTITSTVNVTGTLVASGVVQAGISPQLGFTVNAGDVVAADDLLAANNLGLAGGGGNGAIFIKNSAGTVDAVTISGANRSFKINPSKTRWLSLGGTPVPVVSTSDGSIKDCWRNDNFGLMIANDNHKAHGYFPVNLSHGAVVTGFNVWGFTAAETHLFYCYLYRSRLDGVSDNQMASVQSTDTVMDLSDNTISNGTIDNQNYFYYVYVSELQESKTSSVHVDGIRITYTINEWP